MRTQTERLDRQKGSRSQYRTQDRNGEGLANGLGWFSIGLGLAEVLAPDQVARFIGVRPGEGTRNVLRTYGLREIGAGIGILSQPRPVGWMWGRVAGDVLDLVTLSSGLTSDDSDQTRVLTATAAVVGVTVLDVLCAQKLSSPAGTGEKRRATGPSGKIAAKNDSGDVKKTLIINRPPDEVYRFWRDLAKLPTFMSNLESVQVTGERTSHWKAKGPAGRSFEWDAEITEDQ
ncbi:MAG: cyclase, partial [Acidobacteriota bacterium]|nr:cyclase [Acidobacteriota bacterium]